MAGENTQRQYRDPYNSDPSTMTPQMRDFHYKKKALIEVVKEQYFGQLADVTSMPKHFGKTIKQYLYLPLLDDRNTNDQGIDASGAVIDNGNLYGSSKDVGTVVGKLPVLSETGGRVNRVGFKRIEVEGSIDKFGFFREYTQDSVDFDSDDMLEEHIHRESLRGANEITEDQLQIDLLNAAGVVRFTGSATQDSEVDGSADITYGDLQRLSIDLDNNHTPKQTKMITGSRMVDTKVVGNGRVMYVGSELLPTLEAMKDYHGNPAFVRVEHYAAAGNTLRGEEGKIGNFRIVVVPEMMKWAGVGADSSGDSERYSTDDKFDVFPMLVVGNGSFTTIGFQTDGKTTKFKITHKKPGTEMADRTDPYGETGFMSIKWWYGILIQRPERIALVKTAALL